MKTIKIQIYYRITANGIAILGTSGRATTITIPPRIDDLPVVAVADYAFAVAQEPTLVEEESKAVPTFVLWTADALQSPLPQGTGDDALVRLILPDTIKTIGAYAFSGCNALKSLRLPESICTLGDYAFSDCAALEKLSFPQGLEQIGNYALYGCRSLAALHLHEGITTIGRYAFYNCRSLRTINIPTSAVHLGTGLFLNCDALYDISFGRCQHIADLISVLNHELLLTIDLPGGRAKLFIPDFEYEYIEDTPARQFHQVNYGTGHLFRQCIGNSEIDFRRYDEMFYLTKREDAATFVLILTVSRLSHPYRLQENRKETYLSYLQEHLLWAVSYYLDQEDLDTLRLFATLGLYTKEHMPSILTMTQEKKKTAILSFFMDFQHNTLGALKKKTFDL